MVHLAQYRSVGLSVMARRLGVGPEFVRRLEAGTAVPGWETLRRMVEAYGVSRQTLLAHFKMTDLCRGV